MENTRNAISELLGREGFSVVAANNGLDGLHKLKTDDLISLIVLDLWMPVMDGFKFMSLKQSEAAMATIPVVVLSAIAPIYIEGVEGVLDKPVDHETLI